MYIIHTHHYFNKQYMSNNIIKINFISICLFIYFSLPLCYWNDLAKFFTLCINCINWNKKRRVLRKILLYFVDKEFINIQDKLDQTISSRRNQETTPAMKLTWYIQSLKSPIENRINEWMHNAESDPWLLIFHLFGPNVNYSLDSSEIN